MSAMKQAERALDAVAYAVLATVTFAVRAVYLALLLAVLGVFGVVALAWLALLFAAAVVVLLGDVVAEEWIRRVRRDPHWHEERWR